MAQLARLGRRAFKAQPALRELLARLVLLAHKVDKATLVPPARRVFKAYKVFKVTTARLARKARRDHRAWQAQPERQARREALELPARLAHKAHKAILARPALKASKVFRAIRAFKARLVRLGRKATLDPPDLQAQLRLSKGRPDPQVHKELRAITDLQAPKACRAIRALSARLVLKAQLVLRVRRATPAQAARSLIGDRFGLPKIKLLRLQIQLIRSRSTTPILTQTGLALSQIAASRSRRRALIA